MQKSRKVLNVRRNVPGGSEVQVVNRRKEKAWFDVYFVDDDGVPIPGVEFEITCSDGTVKSCKADDDGYYKDEDVPRGLVEIKLEDGSIIEPFTYADE